MKVIYNLQICRAVAAILVLLEHGSLIIDKNIWRGFFTIGWCGVDFFFVLSGFIIFYVNCKYLGDPTKFKKYILKRLTRIYPVYWIYTILFIVINILVYRNYFSVGYLARSMALYPFHVEKGQYPLIAPAHTLTYELFFYAIFSVGILTNKKILKIVMILWLSGIILNVATGIFANVHPVTDVIFNQTNINFFFGCAIAYLVINKPLFVTKRQASVLLGLGSLLLATAWFTQLYNYPVLASKSFIKFGLPFFINYIFCFPFRKLHLNKFVKKNFH